MVDLGDAPVHLEPQVVDRHPVAAVLEVEFDLPGAAFSAGAAMGRNKLIYALADVAVVVSSAAGSGGTWAGAVEALRARWVPVLVRTHPDAPAGNAELVRQGGIPIADDAADLGLDGLLALAGEAAQAPGVAESREGYEQASLFPDPESVSR